MTDCARNVPKVKIYKTKKSKKIRPNKLSTYIPMDEQGISPSDLLTTDDKNILLVGKPGIGKTAVTHQMLKLWAERDNKELDYMFYFDMRETSDITSSTKSLEDLLFSVFTEPDEDKDGKDEVLQDIRKYSENVTIIFDGLTDLSSSSVVRRLVEKDLLPDAKIVITCRPEVESEDFLRDWVSFRVEVKGFSQQSIRAYLTQMLSTEHLSNVLSNLELFTLCHVPMYALMVVACFSFKTSEDTQQSCTITEISFLKTLEDKVGPTEKKTSSAFLHYTMQEFFAGLWLLKNPEKITGVVQQSLTEEMKHMKHLVPFICGLLNDKNTLKCLIPAHQINYASKLFINEVVPELVRCLDDSGTEGCGFDVNILFLCQCLYESQSTEACLYLLDKLEHDLDLSEKSLDPYHCCAVSYVISQSNQKIQLNLEDVMVSEQGWRPIFGCMKNVQW
ncbi:protein NLRC5-like [Diretmus argenteus]